MMAEAADSSMAIKVLVVKVSHAELHCSAVLCVHSPLVHPHGAAEVMRSPLNDATVLTQHHGLYQPLMQEHTYILTYSKNDSC